MFVNTLDNFFTPRYRWVMTELRVANFSDDLMAKLKAGAALSRATIREFLEQLVAEALKRRDGRGKSKPQQ